MKDLAAARGEWLRAEWPSLASLDLEGAARDPDRGKLALLAACALAQLGKRAEATVAAKRAVEWGVPSRVAAQFLIAGVHNTLGRIAALKSDEAGWKRHFKLAVEVAGVEDLDVAAQDRTVREMAGLGLFADAAGVVNKELWRAKQKQNERRQASMMTILGTELALLNEELSLALRRGQLYREATRTDDVAAPPAPASESMSQLGQDLWVLSRTGGKRGGYFVEFGATDGVALSNTFLLETKYDWIGLLAEPNPKFLASLRRNRKATVSDACIGPVTGERVTFIFADVFGGMAQHSDGDKHAERRRAYGDAGFKMELTTTSLDDFLKRHGAPHSIDYISVDTEGSEYEILKTFPFASWDVRCWTIEHNFAPVRDRIFELMKANGYTRVEAQWDDWYYR